MMEDQRPNSNANTVFRPRSTAKMQFLHRPAESDMALVETFAATFGASDTGLVDLLRRIQPHRAHTKLGARERDWEVHCWALPAASNAAGADAPVALCMHGHGHTCCVTSWAYFFKPLHDAGFHVIALDAPCFGRSGGNHPRESGQANLWRVDDYKLVIRLLQCFRVAPGSQRCAVFAQCMGGAMFLRALQTAPDLFGAFHVMHNATIGAFPSEIVDTLKAKGGAMLAYHEVDPDHMREAVCYKALTTIMQQHPTLCRFIDNERARATGDPDHMNSDHVRIVAKRGEMLSRDEDGSCFYFKPSALVLSRILKHVTSSPRPPPSVAQLQAPVQSAVALGKADVNFMVAVRCRPPMAREKCLERSYSLKQSTSADATQRLQQQYELITVQTDASGGAKKAAKEFAFSRVLGEEADNEMVFSEVALPLIDFVTEELGRGHSVSKGEKSVVPRSATLFAYGQTGSGKTHTISGTSDDPGVIPRMIEELYRRIACSTNASKISCSYVQLYNDELSDLLGATEFNGRTRTVSVREQQNALELVDAEVRSPTSAEEMNQLLGEAAKYRATSATAMNTVSSRSHSLLTVHVGELATILVVDLAGSERVKRSKAAGNRFVEAVSINSSLNTLGRVVKSLTTQVGGHIPYRDSILTRLLANALGGHSRTALVACIAPTVDSAEESCSTLRFAAQATHIKNYIDCEPDPDPELSKAAVEALDGAAQAVAADDPFANRHRSCIATLDVGARFKKSNRKAQARRGGRATTIVKTVPVEVFGDFTAGPSAPVIVCLHYYGHNSAGGAQFIEWFSALREIGYRVLAPSFPGHGNTPGPAPSSKSDPEALAGAPGQLVSMLLNFFGIKKCVIMGHDWGGGVALEFAARSPQRVLAVIGHSISYRDAEESLSFIQKRYAGKQKKLLLCWVASVVHLKKKGLALAKLAGVKLKEADDSQGVLQHITYFLRELPEQVR